MAKNRNLIKNTSYNFKLRSRSSFFIGTYIILSTLLIKTTIIGFITDSSPFGFLTVNYLEGFIFIITFFGVLISLLALFFGNRKHQRTIGNKVWNKNSKKMMCLLFTLITILYGIEFYLLRNGEEAFIIPTFSIGYGLLLLTLNFSRTILLYKFSIVCTLIGFLPLFVEDFGFYTLFILGISHYIFAFVNRTSNDI
jgi:hypothetical protein